SHWRCRECVRTSESGHCYQATRGAPTIVSGKKFGRQPVSGRRCLTIWGTVTRLGHSGCGVVGIHTGLQMLADIGPQLLLQRSQRCEQPWAMEDDLLPSRIFVGESREILLPIEHFRPPSDHVLRWQRINAPSESIGRHWRNWLSQNRKRELHRCHTLWMRAKVAKQRRLMFCPESALC